MKEHKDACTKCLTDKSAIVEHACANDHPINWDETKILQRAHRTMKLVMKEALSIRMTPEDASFNGYELHDCRSRNYRVVEQRPSTTHPRRCTGRETRHALKLEPISIPYPRKPIIIIIMKRSTSRLASSRLED